MQSNYPLVSVIIPTYKNEVKVVRAVESALNQTYKNIEVIVVDDNGLDTSMQMATKENLTPFFSDKRFKYIAHDVNKNGAYARNTGIEASNGDYISFLDDDDWFVLEKTALEVDFLLKNDQYGGVYGGRIQNGKKIIYKQCGDLSCLLLEYKVLPCTCTLMIRRKVIQDMKGFDTTYKRHQDFEFLLRFFESNLIGVIQKPLFYLEKESPHNEIDMNMLEGQKRQFLNTFDGKIDKLDAKNPGFKRHVYAIHFSRMVWGYIRHRDFSRARQVFAEGKKMCGGRLYQEMLVYFLEYIGQRFNYLFVTKKNGEAKQCGIK